jgi:hypothetical protein
MMVHILAQPQDAALTARPAIEPSLCRRFD